MGVIRRVPRSAIDVSFCEDEAIEEIVITVQQENSGTESLSEDDTVVVEEGGLRTFYNSPRRRTLRTRVPAIPADTTPRRNNVHGSRRSRRYENTLVLLRGEAGGRDEAVHDEVSIEDLVPLTQSPRTFSRFLSENSMMGLWHSFIECRDQANAGITSQSQKSSKKTNGKSTDPEHAFHGICRKLRNILKQRHVPLGIVDDLEEQVVQFFATQPLNSTYECGPLDAYRRGLLHAISQYNSLKSFSVGNKKTEKIVHVQNKQAEFVPPSLRLVSYIETRLQGEPKTN